MIELDRLGASAGVLDRRAGLEDLVIIGVGHRVVVTPQQNDRPVPFRRGVQNVDDLIRIGRGTSSAITSPSAATATAAMMDGKMGEDDDGLRGSRGRQKTRQLVDLALGVIVLAVVPVVRAQAVEDEIVRFHSLAAHDVFLCQGIRRGTETAVIELVVAGGIVHIARAELVLGDRHNGLYIPPPGVSASAG